MPARRPALGHAPPLRGVEALRKGSSVLSSTLTALGGDEHAILLTLAVVIGATAGAVVIAFYKTIDAVQRTVLRAATHATVPDVLLIPAVAAYERELATESP